MSKNGVFVILIAFAMYFYEEMTGAMPKTAVFLVNLLVSCYLFFYRLKKSAL